MPVFIPRAGWSATGCRVRGDDLGRTPCVLGELLPRLPRRGARRVIPAPPHLRRGETPVAGDLLADAAAAGSVVLGLGALGAPAGDPLARDRPLGAYPVGDVEDRVHGPKQEEHQ